MFRRRSKRTHCRNRTHIHLRVSCIGCNRREKRSRCLCRTCHWPVTDSHPSGRNTLHRYIRESCPQHCSSRIRGRNCTQPAMGVHCRSLCRCNTQRHCMEIHKGLIDSPYSTKERELQPCQLQSLDTERVRESRTLSVSKDCIMNLLTSK